MEEALVHPRTVRADRSSSTILTDRTMMRIPTVLLLLLISGRSFAQSEEDALRVSTMSPGGSARSNGMGNAFGALGADPISSGINPAGFGLYRTSGMSITSQLEVNGSKTLHYQTTDVATQARFSFSNMALVLHFPNDASSDWRSSTFGVVYDRRQSYHWSTEASGDANSTILQRFVNEAEGTDHTNVVDAFPFTAGLAWNAFGMDTLAGQPSSYVSYIADGALVRQRHVIEANGRNAHTAFFYSGNYMDRLYVGLQVGVLSHRYERAITHADNTLDQSLEISNATYKENLATSGSGFDVKAGFLVRITERLRTGASIHSPQWLLLNDAYNAQLNTTWRTPDSEGNYGYEALSPDGTFAYRLMTPWRAAASAAYLAGTNGSVSVDYEYADMSAMRFRAANALEDLYDFAAENDRIKARFTQVHTVRVGTEWRAGNWYYRGGWGYTPDPYRSTDLLHAGGQKTYAAGVGYRSEHLSIDLGLNYVVQPLRFLQYSPELIDPTEEERSSYRTFITFSFRP